MAPQGEHRLVFARLRQHGCGTTAITSERPSVLGRRRNPSPCLMILKRPTLLAAMLAVATASPGTAAAQGFFERLFGVRPLPPPPSQIPQQNRPLPPPPPGVPGVPPTGWEPDSGVPEGPAQSSGPAPARPVAVRPPTEEGVLGRDLKLNGTDRLPAHRAHRAGNPSRSSHPRRRQDLAADGKLLGSARRRADRRCRASAKPTVLRATSCRPPPARSSSTWSRAPSW